MHRECIDENRIVLTSFVERIADIIRMFFMWRLCAARCKDAGSGYRRASPAALGPFPALDRRCRWGGVVHRSSTGDPQIQFSSFIFLPSSVSACLSMSSTLLTTISTLPLPGLEIVSWWEVGDQNMVTCPLLNSQLEGQCNRSDGEAWGRFGGRRREGLCQGFCKRPGAFGAGGCGLEILTWIFSTPINLIYSLLYWCPPTDSLLWGPCVSLLHLAGALADGMLPALDREMFLKPSPQSGKDEKRFKKRFEQR